MTKTKSTKRALLLSALSLLMCVSMLIGSTFAWFTDSVTSGGNIIKSGTLDVTMEWKDATATGKQTTYKDASTGPIFNYDLWEPGYVEAKNIKISNVGTLALKYQLNIIATGEVSELADVIDVYYAEGEYTLADRNMTGLTRLGTLNEVLAKISTTASGDLEAGTADTVTIALKMQESAGNKYQGLSIGSEFAVQLMATQLTSEFDSFDNQYDIQATYLNKDADGAWLINNMDELFFFASQVNSGTTYKGETVKLTADIDLSGYGWTPIGQPGPNGSTDFSTSFAGTFDGQEHTVSNISVKNSGWAGLFGLAHDATIRNVKVENVNIVSHRHSGGVVGKLYGSLENVHAKNVVINVTPNAVEGGYDNGDKVGGIVGWIGDNGNNRTINKCTATCVKLRAYRDVGGIAGYAASTTTGSNNAVFDLRIVVDQTVGFYGAKDANAGYDIGRKSDDTVKVDCVCSGSPNWLTITRAVSDVSKLNEHLLNSSDNVALINVDDASGVVTVPATYEGVITLRDSSIASVQAEDDLNLVIEGNVAVKATNSSAITSKGELNISGSGNLTAISADVVGGFGIGGLETTNINISDITIEKVSGGFVQKDFVNDAKYGKNEPEGGAAIGSGYDGAKIALTNVTIEEALGGSKAAGIGARYWTGVDIVISDCVINKVVGGNASAAIGGSRVSDDPNDNQDISINIMNSVINAEGGQFAAGIGSGYDTHCAVDLTTLPKCHIEITGNSVITAQGGKYGAGIGTGYHTASLTGKIEESVTVNATAGESREKYTVAMDVGFGVVDKSREAAETKAGSSSFDYKGTTITISSTTDVAN